MMDIISEITGSGIGYMEALKYISAISKKCHVNKKWTWEARKENDFNNFMKLYDKLKTTKYPHMQYICAGYHMRTKRFFTIDNGDKEVNRIISLMDKSQPIVVCKLQEKRKHIEVLIFYSI